MEKTVIDGLLDRFRDLHNFLTAREEISLAIEAESNFKKLFVMACGSFFEEQITTQIELWSESVGGARLAAFVKNKALNRQYHTFFNWTLKNINTFLGLFGSEFQNAVQETLKNSEKLTKQMLSFLALGRERNLLAHGNLAAYSIDKTLDELAEDYRSAYCFTCFLLSHFSSDLSAEGGGGAS